MNDTPYEYSVVRGFAISAFIWLIVGLLLGLLIAAQMFDTDLNFAPYLTFGRLRVVHTNALAFGFTLAGIFATTYYMLQRLTKTRLAFPALAKFHMWFFNLIIVLAAITLFMGMSTAREYAELEWPIDVLVVIMWVIFAVNVFATLFKRKEKHLYVSLWYIIAMTITVAILYIVNNLAIPVNWFKSYSLFSGLNDANVEWWYGHNAVGFVWTVPILSMFYYFMPKATNLPIYSHRLSIIGFWSLIFTYLWTGAHHLMLTPIPEWIQSVGIAFSIFLIVPSWGSVVNGYYTMSGNWDQMRTNYLAKFFVLGITFYGLQTIQGPTQGLRELNQFFHYTDWVVGHVHMGTMGWVTMIISASMYYMVPRLYGKENIYSVKLANAHFWLVLTGQLLYTITMWIGGIMQGIYWKAMTDDGTLAYTFLKGVVNLYPYWYVRWVGGAIYFVGIIVFAYNLIKTVKSDEVK